MRPTANRDRNKKFYWSTNQEDIFSMWKFCENNKRRRIQQKLLSKWRERKDPPNQVSINIHWILLLFLVLLQSLLWNSTGETLDEFGWKLRLFRRKMLIAVKVAVYFFLLYFYYLSPYRHRYMRMRRTQSVVSVHTVNTLGTQSHVSHTIYDTSFEMQTSKREQNDSSDRRWRRQPAKHMQNDKK